MQNMNPMQMMQAFNDFKAQFQGNPREKVQELMRTGQMSQSQFNFLQAQATQFMKSFNIH